MKYQKVTCEVLRPARGGDCTNNGVSARYTQGTLFVPEGMPGLSDNIELLGGLVEVPDLDGLPENTFLLVRREVVYRPYYHAVPVSGRRSGRWSMFGGNFLTFSGDGFMTITGYPVPIHDRVE